MISLKVLRQLGQFPGRKGNKRLCFNLLLLVLSSLYSTHGRCVAAQDFEVESKISVAAMRLAAADDESDEEETKWFEAFDELFDRLKMDIKNETNQYHKNKMISIWASWLKLVEKRDHTLLDRGRFIGRIEDAVGTQVPDWWIKKTRFGNDFDLGPMTSAQVPNPFYNLPETIETFNVRHSPSSRFSINKYDGELTLSMKERKINIELEEHICFVTAIEKKELAFIYSVDYFENDGRLKCYHNETLIWDRRVFGIPLHGGFTGLRPPPFAQLSVTEGGIVIFGVGLAGSFIEYFEIPSGRNIFRFWHPGIW